MSNKVRVRDLQKAYGHVQAAAGVNFEIKDGEIFGLIGPNGAGKTTILRAVCGLVGYRGSVAVQGDEVSDLPRRELGRRIALVPQVPSTPVWMTVGEYVLLGRTPHLGALARESESDRVIVTRALQRLDLLPYAERPLGTLSGGERQRAVVARALAQEASIVILDEPTTALDIGHQQQALELLEDLRAEEQLTLVAAMHDLTLAAQYVDRMVLVRDGRIVADGTPADVLTEEGITEHYDASIRVLEVDGRVAVVPTRRVRP
jgi:iron complex transport system ATP-binding protein